MRSFFGPATMRYASNFTLLFCDGHPVDINFSTVKFQQCETIWHLGICDAYEFNKYGHRVRFIVNGQSFCMRISTHLPSLLSKT
jgi:hypothetical protein